MFTMSAKCDHSVDAIAAWGSKFSWLGAEPKFGLSASGDRPRQPLMHSVLPGLPVKGLFTVSLAFIPSSSVRFDHVAHSGFTDSLSM